jgi:hypothetical protein
MRQSEYNDRFSDQAAPIIGAAVFVCRTFDCPSCGGRVRVSRDGQHCASFEHDEPRCEAWEGLTEEVFLAVARKALRFKRSD